MVRKNYDSLTLKLQDSLDQFERYAEKPRHVEFFAGVVEGVVVESRTNVDYAASDLTLLPPELNTVLTKPDIIYSHSQQETKQ